VPLMIVETFLEGGEGNGKCWRCNGDHKFKRQAK